LSPKPHYSGFKSKKQESVHQSQPSIHPRDRPPANHSASSTSSDENNKTIGKSQDEQIPNLSVSAISSLPVDYKGLVGC